VYPEERRREILNLINQRGRVAVAELSQQYSVSEVTIRADLQILADGGLVVRTHGGAIASGSGLYELSLTKRLGQQVLQKSHIGAAAARLVSNGEAILLDASSTALAVAQHLKQHRDLTIVTHSLAIAHEMLGVSGVTRVMPGGTLHHDTASLIGEAGLAFLETFHIQKGFFGAHGLSLTAGLTDVNVGEAQLKRSLVRLCAQVIAILDSTKWDRVGLISFADVSALDRIITDEQTPVALISQVRHLGVDVMVVE